MTPPFDGLPTSCGRPRTPLGDYISFDLTKPQEMEGDVWNTIFFSDQSQRQVEDSTWISSVEQVHCVVIDVRQMWLKHQPFLLPFPQHIKG